MRFQQPCRRGAIVPLAAILMIVLFALAALSIDLGYIAKSQQELQTAADAAALAGGMEVTSRTQLTGANYDAPAISAAAKPAAIRCPALNKSAQAPVVLLSADVQCGVIAQPSDPTSPFTTASPYNAVQVVARRDASANGALAMFFAPILGINDASVQASATAVCDTNVRGFRIGTSGQQNCSLLPFALDINSWRASFTSGSDQYRYDPLTKEVASGSDNIKELQLYPFQNLVSGNFGTVNLGNSSNSTAITTRQILEGPNADDLAGMGGQFALGSDGTLAVIGNPGMSASIQSALQAIIGQPRTILLYSSVTGNGANATYTVVGFGGVVITRATLTGLHKGVTIQPEFVPDATAYGGGPSTSQFVYSALQLCR